MQFCTYIYCTALSCTALYCTALLAGRCTELTRLHCAEQQSSDLALKHICVPIAVLICNAVHSLYYILDIESHFAEPSFIASSLKQINHKISYVKCAKKSGF